MDTKCLLIERVADAEERRVRRPHKIHFDCNVYCSHSQRAKGGVDDCDHEFNEVPDVVRGDCAIWSCVQCGRCFQFDTWNRAVETEAEAEAEVEAEVEVEAEAEAVK